MDKTKMIFVSVVLLLLVIVTSVLLYLKYRKIEIKTIEASPASVVPAAAGSDNIVSGIIGIFS